MLNSCLTSSTILVTNGCKPNAYCRPMRSALSQTASWPTFIWSHSTIFFSLHMIFFTMNSLSKLSVIFSSFIRFIKVMLRKKCSEFTCRIKIITLILSFSLNKVSTSTKELLAKSLESVREPNPKNMTVTTPQKRDQFFHPS